MKRLKIMSRNMAKRLDERGSALLVSLMVMVGLSLLGLGFVAISETENAIAINERNYAQTLTVAEAGAKMILEWFQDPEWAQEQGIQPHNETLYPGLVDDTDFRPERVVEDADGDVVHQDEYKGDDPELLFDRPFKPASVNRFYGTEDSPDIYLSSTIDAHREFLDAFNRKLFGGEEGAGSGTACDDDPDTKCYFEPGEVTEIKIYAPPIIGGNVVDGWHTTEGTRYGLASIKVTATKYTDEDRDNRDVIAQRSVKLVISEWPFPGPQGPIQSNANIQTGGNFGVHWGKMTSQGSMEAKITLVSLPWFDAYDRLYFEYGYDNGSWPLIATSFKTQYKWLYEIVEREIVDPWYEARARGTIENDVVADDPALATAPHPFKFDSTTDDITVGDEGGWSAWWQLQDQSLPPDYKEVIFPRIDYDFWKEVALQGRGTGNSFYLWPAPAGGEQYTDGVTTKAFAKWVNVCEGNKGYPAEPGFYFFDTKNQLNPQGVGAAGELADTVSINSADDGPCFQMQGFIYVNAELWETQGVSGPLPGDDDCLENGGKAACYYNAPGEPYRDIGYKEVLDDGSAYSGETIGANNGEWDYQDLNDNGEFDLIVDEVASITRPSGGNLANVPLPVPWTAGCNVGTDCSEPHEPYLNIKYNANAKAGMGAEPMNIGWEMTETQLAKDLTDAGLPVECDDEPAKCTSNKYDRDGALVDDLQPILDGVFYIEGTFELTGNAAYFGSVLVNGDVSPTGTAEVWFDEKLIKGDWPPEEMKIPRAYITAQKTDDQ